MSNYENASILIKQLQNVANRAELLGISQLER